MYTTSLNWFTSLQLSMHLKVQCNFDDVIMKQICNDIDMFIYVYMGLQMDQ